MFKFINRAAYRAGLQAALGVIEKKIETHKRSEGELRDQGMSGDEVAACITCLSAVAREIIAMMAKK